jgi:uncharacterized protein
MPYLVDGHNLIPKVPGLSLKAIDDEIKLIELLQDFCQKARKRADIYFDNAAPGQPAAQKYGAVTAHFVRKGRTADDAIRARLSHMGKSAANWTVVSSDRGVQDAARTWRAQVLSAEGFVRKMQAASAAAQSNDDERSRIGESNDEIEDWLREFGG